MKQPIPFGALHEELMLAMSIGQARGIVDTLVAIAEAAGVPEILGTTVRDHVYYSAVAHTEAAIADIADDNPDMATVVKQRWDEMRATNAREREEEETLSVISAGVQRARAARTVARYSGTRSKASRKAA